MEVNHPLYSVLFQNVVVLMVLQGLVTVVYFCLTWICLWAIWIKLAFACAVCKYRINYICNFAQVSRAFRTC